MYTRVAIILLICSVVVAALLHKGVSAKKDNSVDKFTVATNGIQQFITPHSNILIDNKTGNGDLFLLSRYTFAPAYISTHDPFDTVLNFSPKDQPISITENRKVLWQNTDTLYQYTLTCSR